jgi:uncharacterized protein involved in exopolysaccharide biosynthesis
MGDAAPRTPVEAKLADYSRAISQDRRALVAISLVAGILAGAASFLIPPTYQATTTIIPAVTTDKLSGLGGLGASLEDLGLQTSSRGSPPAMYPEIVRSRRLLEQVLKMSFSNRRDGTPEYLIDIVRPRGGGPKRLELATMALRRKIDAALDRRTGVLTIRARAANPQVAAGVANALSILLREFTVQSFASQAGENRRFIEGRLEEVQQDLTRSEEQLRGFRERNLRIGNSPRLLLEEGRLTRGLREQEEIYLTLKRQHELSKIEERRDVPVLNVLDSAAVPTIRSSPRRGLIVAFGLFFGFALGVARVFVRTYR